MGWQCAYMHEGGGGGGGEREREREREEVSMCEEWCEELDPHAM